MKLAEAGLALPSASISVYSQLVRSERHAESAEQNKALIGGGEMRIHETMTRLGAAALLLVPAALATASVPQTATPRRVINLAGRPVQAPFSDAVLVGNTLYIAGSIGLDPQTRRPPAQIEDEVRIVLDHMKAVLGEAGMTMDDLVSVQVYCPDVSLFDRFNAVYRTYFKKDFPARAFLGSGALLFGGHFEVQGVAVKQ